MPNLSNEKTDPLELLLEILQLQTVERSVAMAKTSTIPEPCLKEALMQNRINGWYPPVLIAHSAEMLTAQ